MAVYIGARDLSGIPFGTHQFIVITGRDRLTPRDIGFEKVSAKFLGKDTYGIVIGAHNRGNLAVEFFESADFEAAQEFFGGKKTKWYSSDFDAELHKVDFGNTPGSVAANLVLFRISAFLINQSMDRIPYPSGGLGYNSNSWAQSVIEYSSGKGVEDFKGLDVSNSKRIPRIYFEPVCTVKPRPRLN